MRIHVLKRCKELLGVTKNEIENKKRLLAECIGYIEKDTGAKYPPVIVSPCLFFSRSAGKVFFGGAATGPIKVKDKALCIVIVSLPTLLHFDKDLILGILAEEFLHYTFFIACWIKGQPAPPKDKDKDTKLNSGSKTPTSSNVTTKPKNKNQPHRNF